jgi:hypothetical protein
VYHVEARHSTSGWEIIEVNPRIGGSYIVASTRRHCGIDLIDHWIGLVAGDPHAPVPTARRSTFFRVFYGESGRRIDRVRRRSGSLGVLEDKLLVSEGELLPDVDREIFVGQALWDVTVLPADALADFFAETESYLSVEYRS